MILAQRLRMAGVKATLGGGQELFSENGTWTVPAGVTSVSVICIGAGGSGGIDDSDGAGGGGSGSVVYINDLSVSEGQTYDIQVDGAASSFYRVTNHITANAGQDGNSVDGGNGGQYLENGFAGEIEGSYGARGGDGSNRYCGGGGGGTTGYGFTADGGSGGSGTDGGDGKYGGAGGGGSSDELGTDHGGGGGGGIHPYGMGNTGDGGAGGALYRGGGGGSAGQSGHDGMDVGAGGAGGFYGGGGGGGGANHSVKSVGGGGCVRIIWPGDERYFPDTRTEDE